MNSNVEIKENETQNFSTPSPTTENGTTEQPSEVVFNMKNFEEQKTNLISATTSNKIFKIHLYIALATFAINFFIWWWIVWFGFAYPWWVFVANFFIFTLTFQYYLFVSPNKKEWFKMFIIWYINLFVLLFLVWIFSLHYKTVWFLYPLVVLAIPISIVYITKKYRDDRKKKWLNIHFTCYLYINILLTLIWLDTRGIPWILYTFFTTSFFYLLHLGYVGILSRIQLHLAIFADFQLLCFFIWGTTSPRSAPWFSLVLLVHALVLGYEYRKFSRNGDETKPNEEEQVPRPNEDLEKFVNEHQQKSTTTRFNEHWRQRCIYTTTISSLCIFTRNRTIAVISISSNISKSK